MLKIELSKKWIELPYNKAEQNCEAKAYLTYVEQAIAVPTQLDGDYRQFAYGDVAKWS